MAAFTLSPSTPSEISSKDGLFSPTKGERGMRVTCQAASIPAAAAMERRKLMKLLLFGAAGLPAAAIFPPPGCFSGAEGLYAGWGRGKMCLVSSFLRHYFWNNRRTHSIGRRLNLFKGRLLMIFIVNLIPGGGGTAAKDEVGNSIIASKWLKTHGPGDKTLTQGLKGDPTYLVVESNKTLATYGINAVCTHLGCIVPWNTVEKKFMCPCHGSQYDNLGTVIKGPATLSLELANVDIEDDKVVFAPRKETDFRKRYQ